MKRTIHIILLIISGLLVGSISALWMAGLIGGKKPGDFVDISVDNWSSDWSIGSKAADPYIRARVARHGLLALAKEEAVYFTRAVDDNGDQLKEGCTYEISGTGQDARWWSITLYDDKSRLPMNGDDALSIDATKIKAYFDGSDQAWSAVIAPQPPSNDTLWISSRAANNFDLMIRLYRPSTKLLSAPEATLNTPSIKRLSCSDDGKDKGGAV